MNCLINKWLKPICYVCLIFLGVSCDWGRRPQEPTPYKAGIYYCFYEIYGQHCVILTKDSIYANVLCTRDSAVININRWHQPHYTVWLDGFVPIGVQWRDMVCFIDADRDSKGNRTGLIYGKDSTYIFEHGIRYETSSSKSYLFYDPDGSYTFENLSYKMLIEKGIIPRKFKSQKEAEAHLCIGDSSIFEGIRKVSKAELRTLLWGE